METEVILWELDEFMEHGEKLRGWMWGRMADEEREHLMQQYMRHALTDSAKGPTVAFDVGYQYEADPGKYMGDYVTSFLSDKHWITGSKMRSEIRDAIEIL